MKRYPLGTLLVILLCAYSWAERDAGREHARQVVSALPPNNFLRRMVESGRFGDGVERPWQAAMKQFGIKAAAVEVYVTWFFGPRDPTAVRVIYYDSYDGSEQITDAATLERIRRSGLESKLKAEGIRRAPDGRWVDLPHSRLRLFRAATSVIIWDDPWLPSLPHMFTTFGPGLAPLVAAVGFGDLADVDRLLASGKAARKTVNEALWYACGERDTTMLERLLKAGADVNQNIPVREFGTCLMMAIWSNAPEAVKVLLSSGAKVNGPQGQYDETPLSLAASVGSQSLSITKLLLDAGAKVNVENSYGLTPLMKATNGKSTAALELLIRHGADVNARDITGRTALWFAAERGNVQAVKVLLAQHADVNARDRKGRSALDVAENTRVADLLTLAGAKK